MTYESWAPIPGYEGLYEVSDFGRVRSLERRISHRIAGSIRVPERVMSPTPVSKLGHLAVNLYRDGRAKSLLVHRLVLEAFVGPCPEGMEACHWDDDPGNNLLTNLRWGTRGENMKDAVRNGTHHWSKKEACPRNHPLTGPNLREGSLSKGRRDCKACARERASASRESREFNPRKADKRYLDILAGVDNRFAHKID